MLEYVKINYKVHAWILHASVSHVQHLRWYPHVWAWRHRVERLIKHTDYMEYVGEDPAALLHHQWNWAIRRAALHGREREIASRTVLWLFIGLSCANTPECLTPMRRTVLRWWWCQSNLTVWPWVRARWRLWLGVTTRNVLTSDPQNSSLNHHNGWSLTILWWKIIVKNGASLMTKCDDPTKIVITVYDDIGPS
jgi:hypothetical protein